MNYDAYIFDVDGVLIDIRQSFPRAVAEAVAYETGENCFSFNEMAQLRTMGGFNNEWHVAIAGACWLRFYRELSFKSFARKIKNSGCGLTALRKLCPDLHPSYEQRITRLSQEAYGGMSACRKLYGFDPKDFQTSGYWKNEKPLIDSELLGSLTKKTGIVTGRDRAELELAFEILNWRVSQKYIACSDNPDLDKPNPRKLIAVIHNLGSSHPIYFGDSIDDLDLIKNYHSFTGKPMAYCFIGRENNMGGYDHIFSSVKEFFEYRGKRNG